MSKLRARNAALRLALGLLALAAAVLPAQPVQAGPQRVSVQPLEGPGGTRVRATVSRIMRAKGFRVITGVPRATGTGQYYTWARELGIKAFVASELENLGRRQRITFLVWSGNSGSVTGRWTVAAPAGQLPRQVARQFWRRLGPAVRRAQLPPEWREMDPGPTLRIDAGAKHDGEIVGSTPRFGSHAGRRVRR